MNRLFDWQLPKSWTRTKLGSIATFTNGKAFKSSDWKTKGIPIIRIQNLNNINAPFNYISHDVRIDDKYLIKRGDLLFAWSGTPGTSFGAHMWEGDTAYLNQHIFLVTEKNGVRRKYLYYLLNFLLYSFIDLSKGTAGLSHITKAELENTIIPLPPTVEQDRIVFVIDRLFSEFDNCFEQLQSI